MVMINLLKRFPKIPLMHSCTVLGFVSVVVGGGRILMFLDGCDFAVLLPALFLLVAGIDEIVVGAW